MTEPIVIVNLDDHSIIVRKTLEKATSEIEQDDVLLYEVFDFDGFGIDVILIPIKDSWPFKSNRVELVPTSTNRKERLSQLLYQILERRGQVPREPASVADLISLCNLGD